MPPSPDDPPRIFHVETEADFAAAFPVIVQLRPHLTPVTFAERVRRQHVEGYLLAALEHAGAVRALAGYRFQEHLWCGPVLYVDDLVTDEASRSRGYGDRLYTWIRDLARQRGCTELHLDSGTHRTGAHRFYFRQGMHIGDFHFVEKLTR